MNKRLNKSFIFVFLVMLLSLFLFTACSGENNNGGYQHALKEEVIDTVTEDGEFINFEDLQDEIKILNESYNEVNENPFYNTEYINESYFSMDSNTASYSNLRRYINDNNAINGDIIKTDELINYFDYDVEYPENDTFLAKSETHDCYWEDNGDTNHKLVTITLTAEKGEDVLTNGNNFTFLIDASGSMSDENKLPMIKTAIMNLVGRLDAMDRISIISYNNETTVIANGVKASNTKALKRAVAKLKASGGTNGSGALDKAYEVTAKNFIEGGNNRVIIISDGDFNIGTSSQGGLKELITEKRQSGIYLTCLGVGTGNYKDTTMETLAKYGNGGYAYIDSLDEANKVLIEDINKTFFTVSKDTKTKVTFNKDVVKSYRLVGYENKQLTKEEFEDETTDAGEIGSGATSIVCYEIYLQDDADINKEAYTVTVNYKDPNNNESKTYSNSFTLASATPEKISDDYKFVSALIEFSLILRDSPYRGRSSWSKITSLLNSIDDLDEDEFKKEFFDLVNKVQSNTLIRNKYTDGYVVVNICFRFFRIPLLHKQGEVLTLDELNSRMHENENYTYTYYYDMTLTEEYKEIEVVSQINLYVKFECVKSESNNENNN